MERRRGAAAAAGRAVIINEGGVKNDRELNNDYDGEPQHDHRHHHVMKDNDGMYVKGRRGRGGGRSEGRGDGVWEGVRESC